MSLSVSCGAHSILGIFSSFTLASLQAHFVVPAVDFVSFDDTCTSYFSPVQQLNNLSIPCPSLSLKLRLWPCYILIPAVSPSQVSWTLSFYPVQTGDFSFHSPPCPFTLAFLLTQMKPLVSPAPAHLSQSTIWTCNLFLGHPSSWGTFLKASFYKHTSSSSSLNASAVPPSSPHLPHPKKNGESHMWQSRLQPTKAHTSAKRVSL